MRTGSAEFSDPVGDAGGAGDITTVEVTNDNAGRITFRVVLADRPAPDPHEFISVYLATDSNRATGWYGLDYLVEFFGKKEQTALYRWDASRWAKVEGAEVRWTYENGLRATIDRADIGNLWTFRFLVHSRRPVARVIDAYPDRPAPERDRYDIRIPLTLESSSLAPKRPRVGAKIVARMRLTADSAVAAKPVVRCPGTLAGKRAGGVPLLTLGPEPAAGERRHMVAVCTWRASRRGLLRSRMAVSLADMVQARDVSVRVR